MRGGFCQKCGRVKHLFALASAPRFGPRKDYIKQQEFKYCRSCKTEMDASEERIAATKAREAAERRKFVHSRKFQPRKHDDSRDRRGRKLSKYDL